jgi:hypothetical protein
MEAKHYETPGLTLFPLYSLTSLGIAHKARIQEKKDNDTVYGVLTDSYSFTFVCMRNEAARNTVVSLLACVMRVSDVK